MNPDATPASSPAASSASGTASADERRSLVAAIHATPTMLVLAVAGGGNAAITDLLDVGGASRTVLEVIVPYAHAAMVDLVGPGPADRPVVSPEQADAMARAALTRARTLAPGADQPVVGVAVTAALVSDRPKRGEHRAHVAVARPAPGANPGASPEGGGVDVTGREVRLEKGALDRAGEDRVVADVVLTMIAAGCGLDQTL